MNETFNNENKKETSSNTFDVIAIYQAIFNKIPDPCLIVDLNRKVIDVNEIFRNFFGYSSEEILGKTTLYLARLLSKKGLSGLIRNPFRGITDSNASIRRAEIYKKNGKFTTVEIESHVLRNADKNVGYFITFRDRSESRRV
jgi:PAS domain S-box-containing protein